MLMMLWRATILWLWRALLRTLAAMWAVRRERDTLTVVQLRRRSGRR